MNILDLPIEMTFAVFSHLNVRDIMSCKSVCRLWDFYLEEFILKKDNLNFISTRVNRFNYIKKVASTLIWANRCQINTGFVIISDRYTINLLSNLINPENPNIRLLRYDQSEDVTLGRNEIVFFINLLKIKHLIQFRNFPLIYLRKDRVFATRMSKVPLNYALSYFLNFDSKFFKSVFDLIETKELAKFFM